MTTESEVETATTILKTTVGVYDATTPVAMCSAGDLTLTVRNWMNLNDATPYALSYNCLVCSKDTCVAAATLTDPAAALVAAAVDVDKLGTSDLAGAGT